MDGWHHRCNESEIGRTPGGGEGQRGPACCSPWHPKAPDMTGQLNDNTETGCKEKAELPEHEAGQEGRCVLSHSAASDSLRPHGL